MVLFVRGSLLVVLQIRVTTGNSPESWRIRRRSSPFFWQKCFRAFLRDLLI
jgi:hypothetical protein